MRGQACVLFRSNRSPVQHPRAKPQADGYLKAGSISQGYSMHRGPCSTVCSRCQKDEDLVQTYLDSQTHWSLYPHESGSKWTLNVNPMREEGSNSRSLCSSEVQLFILSGHSYELRCNLIRRQQYSMRGRDNTLTANGLEHQVQFHRTLGNTLILNWLILNRQLPQRLWKAYRYLSSLLLAFGLANTSGPKSQKLLNSGLPITSAADPNPARISATTKWLLPLKHKIKHDQDKQVQKAEEKDFFFLNPSQQI